jgi:hypothetical protein
MPEWTENNMPMDDLTDVVSRSYRSKEWGIHHVTDWHIHFCLWPRRCLFTDKTLWFEICYKGSRAIIGPGEDVVAEYYIDKFEFIKWNLKGKP